MKKIKRYEFAYFSALSLAVLYRVLIYGSYYRDYLPQVLIAMILFLDVFIFFASLIIRKWSKKRLLLTLCTTSIVVIVWTNLEQNILLLYALTIIAAYKIDKIKLIRFTSVMAFSSSLVVVFGSIVGIIQNDVYSHLGRTAYGLGFFYYSSFSFIVYFSSTFYLFTKEKKSYGFLLVYILLNITAYILTTTRITLFMSIISIVIYIMMWQIKAMRTLNNRRNRIFAVCYFPFMFLGNYLITMNYTRGNSLYLIVDELLAHRIALAHKALKMYSINMFGNAIQQYATNENEYFYVDNGYISSILSYGIVMFLLVLFLYCIIMYYSVVKNQYHLFYMCVLLGIFLSINNVFFNTVYNPVLLIATTVIVEIAKDHHKRIYNRRPKKDWEGSYR